MFFTMKKNFTQENPDHINLLQLKERDHPHQKFQQDVPQCDKTLSEKIL